MDELTSKIMDEVMKKLGAAAPAAEECCCDAPAAPAGTCNLTEFVGTAIGHTIGLVIANLDHQIHSALKIDPKYRAIGIISDRTGAGPQIFAADEAVKATNTECVLVECPRDTEGGGGHGCLIVFGAEDVSDARRAVEVCLRETEVHFGDVYGSSAGHLEFQYTARASHVLNKVWAAPLGKAMGIISCAPAGIGILCADAAVKAANVEVLSVATPGNGGTSFSNEVNTFFYGDSGAVKQALIAARDVGKQALRTLEPSEELNSSTTPYIL